MDLAVDEVTGAIESELNDHDPLHSVVPRIARIEFLLCDLAVNCLPPSPSIRCTLRKGGVDGNKKRECRKQSANQSEYHRPKIN